MRMQKVTKTVSDYSMNELIRFREVFARNAARYRSYGRRLLVALAVGIVVAVVSINFLPKALLGWIFGALIVSFFGLLFHGLSNRPLLECPACHNELDSKVLGPYCPECGSDQFVPAGLLRPPNCRACGRIMFEGKGRSWKIRACTYCGVILDEEGV
jgi:hypothetical protein